MSTPALIVIDIQNDYFPDGAFPLHAADTVLSAIETAISRAQSARIPVILIQHVADPERGPAPFFNAGTPGVDLHPRLQQLAGNAPVIVKQQADSFAGTTLHATLQELGVGELILCGMMTQNCVTHTALSRQADAYTRITVLSDACTTVSDILHRIALHALSTRVTLKTVGEALG